MTGTNLLMFAVVIIIIIFSPTHLCSCAAMCTESMMRRRASEICLALTVCCSNLVFTADCEIHSYAQQPHQQTFKTP